MASISNLIKIYLVNCIKIKLTGMKNHYSIYHKYNKK